MVKRKFGYLMGVVALLLLTGAKQDNSIVSTEKDLTVINTTELTKDVRGGQRFYTSKDLYKEE